MKINKKHKLKEFETVHFVSLGCPKNRVDSEVLAARFLRMGLTLTPEPALADIIVVNTCSFISDAKEESVDTLIGMASYKKEGRCKKLLAVGCLSQRYGYELAEEMPELDGVFGTSVYEELQKAITSANRAVVVGPAGHHLQSVDTERFIEPGAPSVYLKIGDGCSRKCAFCAIPLIKGKGASRPIDEIVKEAEMLSSSGVKELNLVSQDSAAYGRDRDKGEDLPALLAALDEVENIEWIRVHYLYPDGVTLPLLKAMGDLPKVVPYLDVPVQHASKNVLRLMRRGHGPQRLNEMIEMIREILPNHFLRTTVLVGHPGEREEDFQELLDFVRFAAFDYLGAFRYSDEEGTPSFEMGPKVSRADSYNRFRKVMSIQNKISRQKKKTLIGEKLRVIIEDKADSEGFVLVGRHMGQAPQIDGNTYVVSHRAQIGEIITARVIKIKDCDLICDQVEI